MEIKGNLFFENPSYILEDMTNLLSGPFNQKRLTWGDSYMENEKFKLSFDMSIEAYQLCRGHPLVHFVRWECQLQIRENNLIING